MTSTLKLGSKIPISELEGDITDSSGLTGFLDDDLTKLSQTGKDSVFDGIAIDFSDKISIANNGAMPYSGWVRCIAALWGGGTAETTGTEYQYINNQEVNHVAATGSDCSVVWIPVKAGDVYKITTQGTTGVSHQHSCHLFKCTSSQQEDA